MSRWNRDAALLGIPDLPQDAFQHVGDGKIKPQGGGGGGGSTTATQYTSNVPEYAKAPFMEMIGKGVALSEAPYQAYGGERVAQFTPLQQQAYQQAGQQQVAGQIGIGSGLAGVASQQALGAGGFAPGQFTPLATRAPQLNYFQMGGPERVGTSTFTQPGVAGQYMSPFIEQALAPQLRELSRQADIQGTQQQAEAVSRGAFGGSRDAIMRAERERNLMQQQGDVLSRGYQSAFEQAAQQYSTDAQRQLAAAQANQGAGLTAAQANLQALLGTQQLGAQQGLQSQIANQEALLNAQRAYEQSRQFGANLGLQGAQTALQGAQTLGQLGQQQFGQQMDITGLQNQLGTTQQQQIQNILNQQYADFQQQRDFPYQQLGFLSDLLRGAGSSTRSIYSTPQASPMQTLAGLGAIGYGAGMKEGGVVGYAGGGLTGLLGDQQLQQRAQTAPTPMGQMAAQNEMAERNALRMAASQAAPQGAPQGQMTEGELVEALRKAIAEGDQVKADVIQELIEEREEQGIAAIAPDSIGDMPELGIASMAGGGVVAFSTGDEVRTPYTARKTSGQRMLDDALYNVQEAFAGAQDPLAIQLAQAGALGALDTAGGIADAVTGIKALPKSSGYMAQLERDAAARATRRAAQPSPAAQKPAEQVAPTLPAQGSGRGNVAGPTAEQLRSAHAANPRMMAGLGAIQTPPSQVAQQVQAQAPQQAEATQARPAGISGLQSVIDRFKQAGFDPEAMRETEEASARAVSEAERQALERDRIALEADQAARGLFNVEGEKRAQSALEGLEGKEKDAKKMAFIQAGLAILSGDPSKGAFAAIGEGALKGMTAYKGDVAELEEKRAKINADLDRIAEMRRQESILQGKERRELGSKINQIEVRAAQDLQKIGRDYNINLGSRAKDVITIESQERAQALARADRLAERKALESAQAGDIAQQRMAAKILSDRRILLQKQIQIAAKAMDDQEVTRLTGELMGVDRQLASMPALAGLSAGAQMPMGGKVQTSQTLPPGFKLDQ